MPPPAGEPISALGAPTENTDTVTVAGVGGREQPPRRAKRHRHRARAGRERRARHRGQRARSAHREHRHRIVFVIGGREQPPDELNATDTGAVPVANGEPDTAVSAPDGLNATDAGNMPVANGEPDTGVNTGAASAPAATHSKHTQTNPNSTATRRGARALITATRPLASDNPKRRRAAAAAGPGAKTAALTRAPRSCHGRQASAKSVSQPPPKRRHPGSSRSELYPRTAKPPA
jgi:hypothetical protein